MYGIEGLLAGRTLVDRYRIEEVIGRGGMGAVYRARDERLGREVAVKVISVAAADRDAHERLRARFQREARVAAGLHHPNVVAVYDFGTDPALGLDFLVMELLRGEDLAARINRKGPPAVPTALDIVYQAARGLAAGHRAGLVHRDVKPGNLFLEPGDRVGELQVKVLDFGIADVSTEDGGHTVTHLTVVGRSPYSPAYASPEQMRGETRLTPATDVFSLGAVAFHLLTGRRAFAASEPRQMAVEVSTALAMELPRVRGLTPQVRRVLQRALAVDAADRFPHAGELVAALGPLVGEGAHHDGTGAEREPRAPRPDEEMDHTRLAPEPTRLYEPSRPDTGTRVYAPPPPRAARPDPRLTEMAPPLRRPAAPVATGPRPGWLRRAARTTWELTLTGAALALFAAAWLLAITGIQEGDLQRVYAGAAGSVVLAPMAIHRVMGGHGSYRFALFGSILGTLAMVYLLNQNGDAELGTVLGAIFLTQVAVCFLAELLTRGRRPDPTHHFPDLRD